MITLPACWKASRKQRKKIDYDITFVNRNRERRRKMTYLEHVRYRGFDGVVIACVDFEDPEVAQLVASDIPVVTIDHIFNNRIAVMSDNVKGMQSLLRYIYSCGHRRIAYIHGHPSSVTGSRLSSFYKTAEELGPLRCLMNMCWRQATGIPTGPRRRRSSFSRFPARPPASCIRMILPAWAA